MWSHLTLLFIIFRIRSPIIKLLDWFDFILMINTISFFVSHSTARALTIWFINAYRFLALVSRWRDRSWGFFRWLLWIFHRNRWLFTLYRRCTDSNPSCSYRFAILFRVSFTCWLVLVPFSEGIFLLYHLNLLPLFNFELFYSLT